MLEHVMCLLVSQREQTFPWWSYSLEKIIPVKLQKHIFIKHKRHQMREAARWQKRQLINGGVFKTFYLYRGSRFILLCGFQQLMWQMASNSLGILIVCESGFRGLAVAVEGWGVSLSTSCLHLLPELTGNRQGSQRKAPVLRGIISVAIFIAKHTLERQRWRIMCSIEDSLANLSDIKTTDLRGCFCVCFSIL